MFESSDAGGASMISHSGHNLRVAIVETYPVPAGHEGAGISMSRRETETAKALCRHGFDVRCFRTTRSAEGSVVRDREIDWRFVPIDSDSMTKGDNAITSADLLTSLREYRPSVVFIKGAGTVMSSALLELGIKTRVAIIGGAHQVRELARYHMVLIETPAQRDFLSARINPSRLVQWPKFVGEEFFGVQRQLRPTIDIIVVGRLIPLKNLSLLAGLPTRGYRIVICGDGPLRESLDLELSNTGNSVEFLGQVDTPDLAVALGQARVLAHPSRSEGLPRAIVEAMAAGTPAVFIAGVVDSPLLDGSNSLSVPADSLCDEIERLLADPDRLRRLSAACRATAEQEFSHQRLEMAISGLARRLKARQDQGRIRSFQAALDLSIHRLRWSISEVPNRVWLGGVRWKKRLSRVVRRARGNRRPSTDSERPKGRGAG